MADVLGELEFVKVMDGVFLQGKTRVWSVGTLLLAMADAIHTRFNPVTVQGEITGFTRAASGHCYFSIKDQQGQLRCAMFRRAAALVDFAPRDGDVVELRGRLDVYPARGELQMVVESLRRAGQGELMAAFMALKHRLEAQGWFDAARKRPLPARPTHLGVVTSLQAAALRDVIATLQRRMPHVAVTVYPASVQGERAVPELLAALELAAQDHRQAGRCDSLLLVRGGGSLEDLWSFNDERLALALTRMPMPVICGVGHETDFTIADFVADVRAPTPTAAAELAGVARQDDQMWLDRTRQHFGLAVARMVQQQEQALDRIEQMLSRPGRQLHEQQARWQRAAHRLQQALERAHHVRQRQWQVLQGRWQEQGARALVPAHERLSRAAQQLNAVIPGDLQRRSAVLSQCRARLEALSPQHTLARGFAWLSHQDGRVLSSVQGLDPGDLVQARLSDGVVDMTVRNSHTLR